VYRYKSNAIQLHTLTHHKDVISNVNKTFKVLHYRINKINCKTNKLRNTKLTLKIWCLFSLWEPKRKNVYGENFKGTQNGHEQIKVQLTGTRIVGEFEFVFNVDESVRPAIREIIYSKCMDIVEIMQNEVN
jgi:hypothetical protein